MLKTSLNLDSDFLMYYLTTPLFVAHFWPDTTGVSVPHISPDQIASFSIAIPPVSEQQALVEYLDHSLKKLGQLREQAEQAIGLLFERRSALISAAVTGKIDVRGVAEAQAA